MIDHGNFTPLFPTLMAASPTYCQTVTKDRNKINSQINLHTRKYARTMRACSHEIARWACMATWFPERVDYLGAVRQHISCWDLNELPRLAAVRVRSRREDVPLRVINDNVRSTELLRCSRFIVTAVSPTLQTVSSVNGIVLCMCACVRTCVRAYVRVNKCMAHTHAWEVCIVK